MAAQRAAQDIAADAKGPCAHLTKYVLLIIDYIFLISDIHRSEHILEASGITVPSPEHPCSTSHISLPSASILPTQKSFPMPPSPKI